MIAFLRKRIFWAVAAGAAAYVRRRYRRWKAERGRPARAAASTNQPQATPASNPGADVAAAAYITPVNTGEERI